MSDQTTKRMFVYGTLKREGPLNKSWIPNAQFVARARSVSPNYDMFTTGWYPILASGGQSFVTGELFDVPLDEARAVTGMERGAGYDVDICEFVTEDGLLDRAEIFVFNEEVPHLRRIEPDKENVVTFVNK